jgi:DNA-binding LacI/PurR family transcriptional regulator
MAKAVKYEDIARLAGVSVATVSRALNNSGDVNPQTKQRIWQIAQKAGYAFRANMPVSISEAAKIISLVIPIPQGRVDALSDPFFMELIGAIAAAAQAEGADVVIHHAAPTGYEDLSRLVEGTRAEGTILLGQSVLHESLNRLALGDAPFIVWGAELPGQSYASVGSDNLAGGRRATRHLASLGRKRIAFLGDVEAPEVSQRYEGYVQALEAAGLPYDPEIVIPVKFDVDSAEAVMDGMLARGVEFDAIFAGSDLIALGAMESLRKQGRAVPEDVSIVGYDDIGMARHARMGLSTVPQDMKAAGKVMVAKLLNARSPRDIRSQRLPTELKVRETCGGG